MSKEQVKRQAAANVFQAMNASPIVREYVADEEMLLAESVRRKPSEPAGKWGNLDDIRAPGTPGAPAAGAHLGGVSGSGTGVAMAQKARIVLPSDGQASYAAPAQQLVSSEELQLSKEPIQVREVGFWPFKKVIVPPNVYVVHTRLGKKEPVTIGMGRSFPYDPYTDAYLVVPAAMQTIGIVANSISSEKQGINVLAYVQWQIQEFSVAYKKLDFSDTRDPLGIVNAQLREQAEAAIKDKIATMTVDEVLTDKQPIIEELTARLKSVAEGRGDSGEGLGIKIVTVQVKEAYVSSLTLWEHLQAPFRHKQEKIARISHLDAQEEVRKKELENRKLAETSEAETMVQIERTKQNTHTEAIQIRLNEERTRLNYQQDADRQKVQLSEQLAILRKESERRMQVESAKMEQDRKLQELRQAQEEVVERTRLDTEAGARQKALDVERRLKELEEETRLGESRSESEKKRLERETVLKQQESEFALLVQKQQSQLQQQEQDATIARHRLEQMSRLELQQAAAKLRLSVEEKEAELARVRQEVENLANPNALATRLVSQLPQLAEKMPAVQELKVLQMGDTDYNSLGVFLARVMAIGESFGVQIGKKAPDTQA